MDHDSNSYKQERCSRVETEAGTRVETDARTRIDGMEFFNMNLK